MSIGYYPNYIKFGINLPECGLGGVPKYIDIPYQKGCFPTNYVRYSNKSTMVIGRQYSEHKISKTLSRIYLGRDAVTGESPWTVLIRKKDGIECSGVLVTFQWVLTAAHCLQSM